jgi:SSS family solute:Na+ symporter
MESKIAWVFLLLMLNWAYCVFWGVRGALQARTTTDYFIAGRALPAWVFIFAATATSFSGGTFVGHPGLAYTNGFQYAHVSLFAITIPLTGVLFLKRQQQFSFWWTGVRPKGHTGLEKDWAAILGRLGLIQGRDGGARQPAERRAALL